MNDHARWGYLAGLLDGEGHITICRSDSPFYRTIKGVRTKRTGQARYGLVVAVSNTDIRLMNKLKSWFGGSYNGGKPFKNHPNWNPKYQWNVCGNKNKELILLAVMPYLVLKREQAKLALEYTRLAHQQVPEKRLELWKKITALNERGKPVETNTSCDSI